MRKRSFRMVLMTAAVLFAMTSAAALAMADTRLYVPKFQFSDSEDTQFLVANQNDRDATVDFWAFTSAGELLGQFQMSVGAHGTRSLTLGEAFQLRGRSVSGWIGAVSSDDGIQLSYSRVAETTESFEAQAWTSKEVLLSVSDSEKDVVHFSNPNPFAANLTVTGTDQAGRFVGVQELNVGAFGQLQVAASGLLRGLASQLRVRSNGDVIAAIDRPLGRTAARKLLDDDAPEEYLALVIDSSESLGAYQVTLSFDPHIVQFSTKDIEGGSSEGFDSKPLVVNVDNAAGQITIGSFQVGAQPSGRSAVARLRVARREGSAARFGIHVDEITDTAGKSLPRSSVSVGMVRMK